MDDSVDEPAASSAAVDPPPLDPARCIGPPAADLAPQVHAGPDPADPLAEVLASAVAAEPEPERDAPAPASKQAGAPTQRRRAKPGAPSFVRASASVVPLGPRWPGLLLCLALLLALALQLLLVQRDALAASAQWRPVVVAVCSALGCDLPPWREPAAIAMIDRGVQPHPRVPGLLSVHASFRNDARWPQPWPTLLLGLSDVDGRLVAQRAFQPREYLSQAPTPALLRPGQSASVQFEVVEPTAPTVAFAFEFQ